MSTAQANGRSDQRAVKLAFDTSGIVIACSACVHTRRSGGCARDESDQSMRWASRAMATAPPRDDVPSLR